MRNIHPTAVVDPAAQLGEDIEVGAYSVIGPGVTVGNGTRIMAHVYLDGWTTLGTECRIFPFASIGTQTQDLKYAGAKTFVEIGDRTTLREYVTVNAGTMEGEVTRVGSDCHIMAYSHVAHACAVGSGVIISNCGTLGGHVVIEDQAIIGGLCGVHQFVRIGRLCMVGGCSKLVQDAPPFMIVDGNPACVRSVNVVGLRRKGLGDDAQHLLKEAFRILYHQQLSTSQAVAKVRAEVKMSPEVQHLLAFIEASARGTVK